MPSKDQLAPEVARVHTTMYVPYPPPHQDRTPAEMYFWVCKYNDQARLAQNLTTQGRRIEAECIKDGWRRKRDQDALFDKIVYSFDGNFLEVWKILWEVDEISHLNPDSDDEDDSAQPANAKKRQYEEAFGPSKPARLVKMLWVGEIRYISPFLPTSSFSSLSCCCWCCPVFGLTKKMVGNYQGTNWLRKMMSTSSLKIADYPHHMKGIPCMTWHFGQKHT